MPQSRTRPGNHHYQKPSDIPAKQRAKPTTVWMFLMGAFGLLIAWLAGNGGYITLGIGAVVGVVIGFFIGKRMQEDVKKK